MAKVLKNGNTKRGTTQFKNDTKLNFSLTIQRTSSKVIHLLVVLLAICGFCIVGVELVIEQVSSPPE